MYFLNYKQYIWRLSWFFSLIIETNQATWNLTEFLYKVNILER